MNDVIKEANTISDENLTKNAKVFIGHEVG
jgi:hypothetical protein